MSTEGCLLSDGSVFLGYASIRMGDELSSINRIKSLFSKFKDRLLKNLETNSTSEDKKSLKDHFYNPKFYYTFGKFDICVFALIEEFQFANRTFRSYNIERAAKEDNLSIKSEIGEPFQKQVFLGPTPRFNANHKITNLFSKIDPKKPKYPLISITQIKLNDLLILPLGAEFIRAVILKIKALVLEADLSQKCDFFILESYSWSELTLVVLQTEYKVIFDILPLIRELICSHILDSDNGLSNKLTEAYDGFRENNIEFTDLPIVVHTSTTLGFDFEIFNYLAINDNEKGKLLWEEIESNDKIIPISKWFTQAGSLSKAVDKVYGFRSSSETIVNYTTGQGDILHPPLTSSQIKVYSTKQFIDHHCKTRLNCEPGGSVTSSYTVIARDGNPPDEEKITPLTFNEIGIFEEFIFSTDQIKKLHQMLKGLFVPKIVQESLINMITLYNSGIKDKILFGNFLELHSFIKYFETWVKLADQLQIKHTKDRSATKDRTALLEKVHSRLDRMLHSFMYAYNNRFHASYITGEINEFNLFFDGGIHQLVSAFDGLFKATSRVFSNPSSFVYIEGDPVFTTSEWALRLNYFHVFHPEKLAAVIFQESAMNIKGRYRNDYRDFFRFQNPNKDKAQAAIDRSLRFSVIENEEDFMRYGVFAEILTPEYFDHILADMIGFQFLYLKNSLLFKYWCWGYFSTNSYVYYKDQDEFKFQDIRFIKFLLRQLIVFKFCAKEKEYYNYEFSFSPDFKNLYSKHNKVVRQFIEKYLCSGEMGHWFEEAVRFCKGLSQSIFNMDMDTYIKKIQADLVSNTQKFELGQTIIFQPSTNDISVQIGGFIHAQKLLYSYLQLLFLESNTEEKNNVKHLLTRKNGTPISFDNDAKILFDPIGGIFITDASIRRKLYLYRSVLHASLWDLAVKQKWSYLIGEVNAKSKLDNT